MFPSSCRLLSAVRSEGALSCHLQPKPRSAHLCVHHGLPHHPLPAACVWAKVPPNDPPLHGNGNQAVWHVHRRWPQRLCRPRLHASGECLSLEAHAGCVSWFSSLGVKCWPSILLRYEMWSFSPMAVQLLTPLACQDSRFSAMARETATTPPRSNTWRTKGYEDSQSLGQIEQHASFLDLVGDRGALPLNKICATRWRLRSWWSFWSCMTPCMSKPAAGLPPWKTTWRVRSSVTSDIFPTKTRTHRWV